MNQVYNQTISLLKKIGIDIRKDGVLVDQDYDNIIIFNHKILKSPGSVINHKTEMEFAPYNHVNIMNHIFSYYLKKIEFLYNKTFIVNYTIQNPDGTFVVVLKDSNGNEIKSLPFHLIQYAYDNMISILEEECDKINEHLID